MIRLLFSGTIDFTHERTETNNGSMTEHKWLYKDGVSNAIIPQRGVNEKIKTP